MTDQPILRLFREAVAAQRGRVQAEKAWIQAVGDRDLRRRDPSALEDLARILRAAVILERDAAARFGLRLATLRALVFVDLERRRGGYVDGSGQLVYGYALVAEEGS